MKKVAK